MEGFKAAAKHVGGVGDNVLSRCHFAFVSVVLPFYSYLFGIRTHCFQKIRFLQGLRVDG